MLVTVSVALLHDGKDVIAKRTTYSLESIGVETPKHVKMDDIQGLRGFLLHICS
jgi:hypothetical protein